MTKLDDLVRSLVEANKIGDATTLALRELGPEVLGFLSGVLGDDDGDEVFSTFSECLWQSLEVFRWGCSLRTWAYKLARNEMSRFRRGERRHLQGRLPISEYKEVLEEVRKTHSTLAPHRSVLTWLRNELPVEDRELLILRVDRGFAFEDIALACSDSPDMLGPDEIKRESARLRKRFQLVKQRLMARVREFQPEQ